MNSVRSALKQKTRPPQTFFKTYFLFSCDYSKIDQFSIGAEFQLKNDESYFLIFC